MIYTSGTKGSELVDFFPILFPTLKHKMHMKRVAIGIDIGGTNTVLGVVDENGDVLVKDSISTPTHGDAKKYVHSLSDSINELIDSVHKLNADAEVMGIGIGAPNGNYYKGTIEQAANLAFKGVVPLVDMLRENFPHLKALALTNDANAAAMGEMIYGGAKGMKNFVMITLGTGLGSVLWLMAIWFMVTMALPVKWGTQLSFLTDVFVVVAAKVTLKHTAQHPVSNVLCSSC